MIYSTKVFGSVLVSIAMTNAAVPVVKTPPLPVPVVSTFAEAGQRYVERNSKNEIVGSNINSFYRPVLSHRARNRFVDFITLIFIIHFLKQNY